jgi:hypothetical protein
MYLPRNFGTIFFFAVFSAFLRVYQFGVNRNFCYGSFLWNFGIRIQKIRIGFKSFFRIGLKIRKSRSLKTGIRNNTIADTFREILAPQQIYTF